MFPSTDHQELRVLSTSTVSSMKAQRQSLRGPGSGGSVSEPVGGAGRDVRSQPRQTGLVLGYAILDLCSFPCARDWVG